MYRNQTLIDATWCVLGKAFGSTYHIENDENREFMRNAIMELQDLSQLKVERTARIERISSNDEQFRERYMTVMLDVLGWHMSRLSNNYVNLKICTKEENKQMYKIFYYIRARFRNFIKYKADLL